MISKAKITSTLTLDPDYRVHQGEGDAAFSPRNPSRFDCSDNRSTRRFREERGGRPPGRPAGRGRTYVEPFSKSRIFIDPRSQEGNKGENSFRNEECRISKILRKLSRENEVEKFLLLAKQLQEVLLITDNALFIRNSMELLFESLLDLIHSAPSPEARLETARCMGRAGYALRTDYRRFVEWLFIRFFEERSVSARILLIKALETTANLEANLPILTDFASAAIVELKMALEDAQTPELVSACIDVVLILKDIDPECFPPYFRDTVDILVGWALSFKDASSSSFNFIKFALSSLHQLDQRYWLADIPFTTSLLSQLLGDLEFSLEDIQELASKEKDALGSANSEEVDDTETSDEKPPPTPRYINTLLRVFNTIASCVSSVPFSPSQGPSISKLLKNAKTAFTLCPSSSLVINLNIGVALLLPQLKDLPPTGILGILEYISSLMMLLPDLDEDATVSTIQIVTKVVTELGQGLPADLASSLLSRGSPLSLLKNSPYQAVIDSLIQLYRSFLQHPHMLKEMIWIIKTDTDESLTMIIAPLADPTSEEFETAEKVMAFHVQAVTEIVLTGKGAAGLLELVLHWRPESALLALRCPALHYALLSLTHAQCSRFNNFVTSGIILNPETNYQFPAVVMVLSRLLQENIPTEALILVLIWTRELLLKCQQYLHTLLQIDYFLVLIEAVLKKGQFKHNDSVVMLVCSCFELLVDYLGFLSKPQLLKDLVKLCCHHINSLNPEVAEAYNCLLPSIPIAGTLACVSDSNDVISAARNNIIADHVTRGSHCLLLSTRNFKTFMDYLLSGEKHENDEWLREIFLESYPLGLQAEGPTRLTMKQTAFESRSVLYQWACYEAAQVCVLNKLRTSLGKPPETFTAFEAALKTVARDSTALESASIEPLKRARVLLEFMEYLEKAIYNASEGTAVTLVAPPKNVRTFFNANKNTCVTWLTRLRLVIGIVGIRAGQPAAAVRNLYSLLADLHASKNTQSAEFESAIVYCSCALLALKDPEAITGLYVWCQKEADRKFSWLLPMAHHAGNRWELAIEGYKTNLCKSQSPGSSSVEDKSPAAKAAVESLTFRLLNFCLLDCFRRSHDFENLLLWLGKSMAVRDSRNGALVDKSFDPPWSPEDVVFLSNFHEMLMKKSSKYQWRGPVAFVRSDALKALDESILDVKIAGFEFNNRCKQAVSYLSDWSQVTELEKSPQWGMDTVVENVKQSLIKTVAFGHIGQSLENKAYVMPINDSKIEIGLHMNPFLEQWGGNYEFGLSSLFRDIKNHYSAGKTASMTKLENEAALVKALLGERLRSGRVAPAKDLLILHILCNDVLRNGRNLASMNSAVSIEKRLPSDVLLQLSFWKSLLTEDNLKLDVLKSARKEGNLELAKRCLLWHFKGIPSGGKNLADVCDELVENFDRNMTLVEGELCLQVAKLLYGTGAHENAMDFASLTALKLIRFDNRCEVRQCGSRMLLSLAKWLQRMPGHNVPPSVHNLIQIPDGVLDNLLQMPCDKINAQTIIPEDEMAIGKVLAMSVAHCSSLAKTWCQYASWCYRWGRKMVDAASNMDVTLSESELIKMRHVLPGITSEEEMLEIVRILSRTRAGLEDENVQTDLSTLETIQNQLRAISLLSTADDNIIMTLIEIWRESQNRINSAYRKAAEAYFKYLHLCSDSQYSDTRTLTATLRILRLLVKHAVELQDLLEKELPKTPPQPWQGIIPQLFSRLNHPEVYVRARLAELLCRIAQTAPNLIIFPAVVGSSAGANRIADINTSTSKLLATCLSQNSEEEGDEVEEEAEEDEYESVAADSRVSVLTNCYKAMVDTLAKQTPEVINGVQRFVSELRRITVLWDELWLGTLNQHNGEVTRRISQLEQEVRKVDSNPSLTEEQKPILIAEKHRILMKPVVFILEQLKAITSVTPETPHEVWFQENLGDAINVAMEKLCNPADPRDPSSSWQAFQAIHVKLQKRAQKRACTLLKMENISPVLYNLKDTMIPMPGVCGPPITVSSVNNAVIVLPTKTKPKKLVFHSSTGTTHTYLFKGLEDLHLDERIMQFLAIANTMLGAQSGSEYRARHYSVTPLGRRSGLISWVDNVIPLFTLYKKWHQRDMAIKQLSLSPSAQILRPSDLYYNKLTPLLKEAGVSVERRKDWPLPILKQVLEELMKETPSDLLSKELWCNSHHVDDWWEITKRYSRSVAVMSVIGYIIGLGDRHLDNVLIDLHSGEMVHIDYNVCFEKGKTLRVPEKVPFRMTQNIKGALGVTGVEGQFQLSAEHVLKILKQGRETLLPLLEAFVYDPLIDWTPGSETGYTGAVYGGGEAVKETRESRKALEKEVTRAMFTVRITEMKAEWLENKEKVLSVLPDVKSKLEQYLLLTTDEQEIEENLADAHQQMLLVKEAQAMGTKHSLFTLASRCSLLLKARSAHATLSQALKDKRDEYDRDIVHYQNAVREIKGEGLSKWIEHVASPMQPDSYNMFDLVKQFLQTAGQGGMVNQCDQTEADVGELDTKQRQLLKTCIELLRHYGSVVSLYPSQNRHRALKFRSWADKLLDGPPTTDCSEIIQEFESLYGDSRVSSLASKKALAYSTALQKAVADAEIRVNRAKSCVLTADGARAFEDSSGKARDGTRVSEDVASTRIRETVRAFDEATARVRELAQADKKSGLAVELVLIMTLCSVNQRFLKMEAVAKSADDGLEAMRLKDGQGWLEEMCAVSGIMEELTSMLPSVDNENTHLQAALLTVAKTHAIFQELMELHINFHSIILPEALKCSMTEHPDMIKMMQDLKETIENSGDRLDDVQKQLKGHLCALIMNMKSARGEVQTRVAFLRAGLGDLLQRPCLDAGRSPGQMLLMGFHVMLEKLTLEGKHMVSLLGTIPIQPEWRKLDQIREATSYTALTLDERTTSVTDDMFLVRRVQTIYDFFVLCLRAGASFRGEEAPVVTDDDALNRPIRRFTAEFVSRIMLGATSQALAAGICILLERLGFDLPGEIEGRSMGSDGRVCLEDLCQRALDLSLQKGATSNQLITKATSLVTAMQFRYRELKHSKLMMDSIESRERVRQRLQDLLTAHSWYFEDLLLDAGANTPLVHSRSTFMTKLRKASSTLISLQTKLAEARDSQRVLVASVEQRLRWAGGANPALVEVLSAFEAGITGLDARLDMDSALATQLSTICGAVLRYEALRTRTSEALIHDEAMLKILEQWQEMTGWLASCREMLSPVEESLLELMTPESATDPRRLYKLESRISENIEKWKSQRKLMQEKIESARIDCETEMEKLKALLGNHHALMTEVRQPLKSMAKLDEWGGAGVAEYLEKYRIFSENIGAIVGLFSSDRPPCRDNIQATLIKMNNLPEKVEEIYEDLIAFGEKGRADGKKRPPLLRQESVFGSPKHSRTPQRPGKGSQERNAYALGVWRRIQMKLEGRDPDPGRRSAPHEQIDYIIREATSLDNLALLYEGWTPWV